MDQELNNNNGAPENGALNNDAKPKTEKKQKDKRKKSKTPTGKELYQQKFFLKDVPLQDLKMSTLPRQNTPEKLMIYLKRKMDGAAKRKGNLVKLIGKLDTEIRDRFEYRGDQKIQIAEPQWQMKKVRKKQAEAALIMVNMEYTKYSELFENELSAFVQPHQDTIALAKEDRYIGRIAPSRSKMIIELLDEAGRNGKAEQVKLLTELIVVGKKDEFRSTFRMIIKELQPLTDLEFEKRPKLLTKVVDRVIVEYTNRKEAQQ
ncbi:MAG: hypothetical protein WCW35_05305 [Bacteroidota bacterium]|jgi:hypothetical protein